MVVAAGGGGGLAFGRVDISSWMCALGHGQGHPEKDGTLTGPQLTPQGCSLW